MGRSERGGCNGKEGGKGGRHREGDRNEGRKRGMEGWTEREKGSHQTQRKTLERVIDLFGSSM